MTSRYLYRGTSLRAANDEEFGPGRIDGFTADIFRGSIEAEFVSKTIVRGTPVDELPWWTPEGEDRGYLAKQQGVTGGLSNVIGTGIGFSNGSIPIVLYLRERSLNGTGSAIRYTYNWFDAHPGALAWVYGSNVSGEIRDMDDGLVGLTTQGEDGPLVWVWGDDDVRSETVHYEDENEVLVFEDHIDVTGAIESATIMLEGRRTPAQALSTFERYHAGWGDEGEDVSRWSEEEQLAALHREVQRLAETNLDDLWTINLTSQVMEKVNTIPEDIFDFAYDGNRRYEDYDAVPGYLLGAH